MWDKKENTIVSNESSKIIRIMNSAFNDYTKNRDDYYPENARKEINSMNDFVYDTINNGVYLCGFATTQKAYEEAFYTLFDALETVNKRLNKQKFLVGSSLTEADIRLFTTLVRFDPVYYSHKTINPTQTVPVGPIL